MEWEDSRFARNLHLARQAVGDSLRKWALAQLSLLLPPTRSGSVPPPFSETDGLVMVRKDWKVLTVEATGPPARPGAPLVSSASFGIEAAT